MDTIEIADVPPECPVCGSKPDVQRLDRGELVLACGHRVQVESRIVERDEIVSD